VLRILSDLHVYDVRSQVRDFRQLEPLLAGVHTLVINGDSCEMRPGVALPDVARLQNFFRERVAEVIFVTGNHDPDISDTHELLLADARVWVTHGDVFFDDLTPWSRKQPDLVRAVNGLLAAEPAADYHEVTTRLRVAREAARIVGVELDPADGRLWAQFVRLCDTFFPPRQVLAMLRSWRDLPALAAKLAVAQRSSAQVVVTGHVHFPGVWVRSVGPTVINTGSFFSPLGGHMVDVSEQMLQVRRIRSRRGQFEPGRLVAVIPLTAVHGG
jgi:predicted phosphodiesterase